MQPTHLAGEVLTMCDFQWQCHGISSSWGVGITMQMRLSEARVTYFWVLCSWNFRGTGWLSSLCVVALAQSFLPAWLLDSCLAAFCLLVLVPLPASEWHSRTQRDVAGMLILRDLGAIPLRTTWGLNRFLYNPAHLGGGHAPVVISSWNHPQPLQVPSESSLLPLVVSSRERLSKGVRLLS